jgi:hypothetical protein
MKRLGVWVQAPVSGCMQPDGWLHATLWLAACNLDGLRWPCPGVLLIDGWLEDCRAVAVGRAMVDVCT